MHEYPKALYRDGWRDLSACVVVLDAAEEAHARQEGYRMLSEGDATAEPAEPVQEPVKPRRGRPRKEA